MKIPGMRTRSCFGVGKCIEYLVDMVGVRAFDFDGMRGKFSIKSKSALKVVRNKFRIGLPLGKDPRVTV